MRPIILIIFSVCFIPNIQGQIYEVGAMLGGSNFIGDVGSTTYISPNKPAVGLLAKWNRSTRHSLRASLLFTQLAGNDKDSNDSRRQDRNYRFENSIVEFSAGMEFTFLDFDLFSTEPQFTPYLFTGISMARHKNILAIRQLQPTPDIQLLLPTSPSYPSWNNTYNWAVGIPMVFGIKGTISSNFILGAEIGVRYTFSDKIDGSNPDTLKYDPDNPQKWEAVPFGNINSNDWYVFSGITLTYTFGQRPCYCYF